METKRNLKYFTAPPISIPALIGWAITLVGVIMLMVRYLRFAGIVVTIVGFATVVFASGGASNDTDLEYQISERIKNLQERSEKKFEVYEKSFLKMLKPIDLAAAFGKVGNHITCHSTVCTDDQNFFVFHGDASLIVDKVSITYVR